MNYGLKVEILLVENKPMYFNMGGKAMAIPVAQRTYKSWDTNQVQHQRLTAG